MQENNNYEEIISKPQSKIAIEIKDVNFSVDYETILENINISVPTQGCTVFLGTSGSGKSTLLKLMGGILIPTQGKVSIFENDVNNLFQREKLSFLYNNVAFVFQEGGLINNLSVSDNITLALNYYGTLTKSEINNIADNIIKKFNLENIKNKLPGKLSLGQKKFVGLARAFTLKPNILFLDEPTSNIELESVNKIVDMIRKFIIFGGTIVSATSDMIFANSIASILGIIDKGKIIDYGTPSKIKISNNLNTKRVIKNIYKEADLADEVLKLISNKGVIPV